MNDYDSLDKSNQGIRFEDPHFPAYLRLYKWKILDICLQLNANEAFKMFVPVFGDWDILTDLIAKIMMTEEYIKKVYPDLGVPKLDPEKVEQLKSDMKKLIELEEKRKQYMEMRMKREITLVQRAAIEEFFAKVLFNEKGLEIADRILFKYCPEVYHQLHWRNCPKEWPAKDTFFEKFYYHDEPNKPSDRCGVQLLDRVARSARGSSIHDFFEKSQKYINEFLGVDYLLKDLASKVEHNLIAKVLHEGPQNRIVKSPDGGETKTANKNWNVHNTLLLIASFPLFDVRNQVEKQKHEDWYFNLLDAMSRDPYNRAALYFLHSDYEETLREKDKESRREKLLQNQGTITGETAVEDKDEIREMRPQPKYEPRSNPDENDHVELVLRAYQEELVSPACRGSNVVIVAPTGSGKTEVAIYAALKHFEEREEKNLPSRVVMVVPKIPLVGQQKDRFLKYCRGKYYVDGFHGSEKVNDGRGRKDEVLRCHVAVMTPQILLNMWQSVRDSERLYICDFSMVIFDEVHKTTGNHPYGEIARMAQEYSGHRPQIVGLTASLNVKATMTNDEERMLGEIFKLLASLDASVLSTIKEPENLAELNKHVSKPDDSVVICQPPNDSKNGKIRGFIKRYLKLLHEKLLVEIENLINRRVAKTFAPYFMKQAKKLNLDDTAYYETWLQIVTTSLNKLNSIEKTVAQMNVQYLKAVVEARGIVEVMPAYVAFDYLNERISSLMKEVNLPQFSDEFSKNQKTLNEMKRSKEDNIDPEIVIRLQDTLRQQFENKPDSRAIIFVTQRSTAERVCDFLNKSKILADKNKSEAFGFVLGTNNQGNVRQTQQQQQSVIEKFNNGKLKVMVATSVVEEGLDVATCNLIIKYNCSSGSAIQLTQQRGRARAKNSRSVLLVVTSKVNENENNALIAEKYMRQCVNTIQSYTAETMAAKVEAEKEKIRRARIQEEMERNERRAEMQHRRFRVVCSKCNEEFCKSDAIKKIYSNYMIMDPEIWPKFDLETKRKANKFIDENTQPLCTLKCAKCQSVAGKAFKQRGAYVPQVDVRILAFAPEEDESGSILETKSKWTNVENDLFYIADVQECHLKIMLNALRDGSEQNLDKLRILDYESKELSKGLQERDLAERNRREAEEKKNAERQKTQKVTWEVSDDDDELEY